MSIAAPVGENPLHTKQAQAERPPELCGRYVCAVYSCMQGDPKGWRKLTDGYISVELRFFPESIESPYRLVPSGKTGRELNLKITAETKLKKAKDTFLQWQARGSCLSYGAQLVAPQQLSKLLEQMQEGVRVARQRTEEQQRDEETRHRLHHLNRTGQTTQAFQILVDKSAKAQNQGKVMIRVNLPSKQTTMTLAPANETLQGLLRSICAKRKLDTKTMGLKFASRSEFIPAAELEQTRVGDLKVKEVEMVDLTQIVNTKKDKAAALHLLSAHAASSKSPTKSLGDVFLEVQLPDKGQTTVKVPAQMSMGEFLFYIAHKRSLDVGSIFLAEQASGRRPLSMKGTVANVKKTKIHVVMKKQHKHNKKSGSPRDRRTSSVTSSSSASQAATPEPTRRKVEISSPTLQSTSRNLGKDTVSRSEIQRVTSMLAEGVTTTDPRMPRAWSDLFSKARVEHMLQDTQQRQCIMDVIESSGGPNKMLTWSTTELESAFAPARNVRRSGTVSGRHHYRAPVKFDVEGNIRRADISGPMLLEEEPEKRRRKAPAPPSSASPTLASRRRTSVASGGQVSSTSTTGAPRVRPDSSARRQGRMQKQSSNRGSVANQVAAAATPQSPEPDEEAKEVKLAPSPPLVRGDGASYTLGRQRPRSPAGSDASPVTSRPSSPKPFHKTSPSHAVATTRTMATAATTAATRSVPPKRPSPPSPRQQQQQAGAARKGAPPTAATQGRQVNPTSELRERLAQRIEAQGARAPPPRPPPPQIPATSPTRTQQKRVALRSASTCSNASVDVDTLPNQQPRPPPTRPPAPVLAGSSGSSSKGDVVLEHQGLMDDEDVFSVLPPPPPELPTQEGETEADEDFDATSAQRSTTTSNVSLLSRTPSLRRPDTAATDGNDDAESPAPAPHYPAPAQELPYHKLVSSTLAEAPADSDDTDADDAYMSLHRDSCESEDSNYITVVPDVNDSDDDDEAGEVGSVNTQQLENGKRCKSAGPPPVAPKHSRDSTASTAKQSPAVSPKPKRSASLQAGVLPSLSEEQHQMYSASRDRVHDLPPPPPPPPAVDAADEVASEVSHTVASCTTTATATIPTTTPGTAAAIEDQAGAVVDELPPPPLELSPVVPSDLPPPPDELIVPPPPPPLHPDDGGADDVMLGIAASTATTTAATEAPSSFATSAATDGGGHDRTAAATTCVLQTTHDHDDADADGDLHILPPPPENLLADTTASGAVVNLDHEAVDAVQPHEQQRHEQREAEGQGEALDALALNTGSDDDGSRAAELSPPPPPGSGPPRAYQGRTVMSPPASPHEKAQQRSQSQAAAAATTATGASAGAQQHGNDGRAPRDHMTAPSPPPEALLKTPSRAEEASAAASGGDRQYTDMTETGPAPEAGAPPPPPPPLPTISEERVGLLAELRTEHPSSKLRKVSASEINATRKKDPRNQMLAAIRSAGDKRLLKPAPPPAPREEEPRDVLLAAIRSVDKSTLHKAVVVERPKDTRSCLLQQLRGSDARSGLKKAEVNAHKAAAPKDPRDTLLGAVRSFDKSHLKKTDKLSSQSHGNGDGSDDSSEAKAAEAAAEAPVRGVKLDARTALLASLGGLGRGKATLRKVQTKPRPTLTMQPKNELMNMLASAMDARRQVLSDDESDFSDDEGWE